MVVYSIAPMVSEPSFSCSGFRACAFSVHGEEL
jgi:hypothetical protein